MKSIVWILVIGIFIRLFLAFSTFHSDIQPFYFAGSVIAKGNILNFYDYLGSLSPSDPILKVYPTYLFNYPPLVYFFLGPISYFISLPFGRELLHNFIFALPNLLGNIQLNFLLLSLKFIYLPFDLGLGFLLYKLLDKKMIALGLWIFNPVNLYSTYMMGQFDVIPTFLAILALFLVVKKNRFAEGAFFLGLGASFKIFPFLFLIPLVLVRDKWVDRFKLLTIGFLPYVLSIIPFVNSSGFRSTALVAGQTTKSLYASIPISGGEAILLFPTILIFFYLLFLYRKFSLDSLWKSFFIVILLFFIFTHYHPQWLLWLTPFMIIDLIKSRFSHWPLTFLVLITWAGQITFFDPGLSVRLFAPLFPSLSGLNGVWPSGIDINFARSVLQSMFAGTACFYIYKSWR